MDRRHGRHHPRRDALPPRAAWRGVEPRRKNSDDRNMATLAAPNDPEPCLDALIAAAKDIDAQDDRGRSAAMLAAFQGRLRWLNVLIGAGADIHARDHKRATALRLAASFGSGDCVRAPIDAGHTSRRKRRRGGGSSRRGERT